MDLKTYLASIHDKTVAVIGIGVSNTPLIERLLAEGIDVTACDRKSREALGDTALHLEHCGAKLRLGESYLQGLHQDIIFRTPGLRPDVPELLAAQESVITSEMEVFFQVCPCPIIGVTGSDGKTTTTTILAELLRKAGKTVHLGGNIGHPLLATADQIDAEDFAVVELSSFQLMTLTRSPHIAIITNLAPNHLDMHRDMAEYVAAKENIFTHQGAQDVAIFNMDNSITCEQSGRARGRVLLFSRQGVPEEGVFLRDGVIFARRDGAERAILRAEEILLPGVHNIENYMAAIAAVLDWVPDEVIRDFARSFAGVEHRIEHVRTLRGVRYYNDSIASSPSRTIAGLHAFRQKVILIAGGYDKQLPFDALGPEICAHVKTLILCGATADKIRAAVENAPEFRLGSPEILTEPDFKKAILLAAQHAAEGDVVTLSPACAAFDQFPNFAVRGKTFRTIVEEMK